MRKTRHLLYFRIAFRSGAAGERMIREEKRCLLTYASVWQCLARFRAGVAEFPAPKPCQDGSILAHWIAVLMMIRKQAGLVYASSAKRTASTRPGPFLGIRLFLRPWPHDVDSGSIELRLQMCRIVFLNHLYACPAVLRNLINVGTFEQAQANVGVAQAVRRSRPSVTVCAYTFLPQGSR